MDILGLRALHLIGVVVWFAGLFYLGRLFVYHREACLKPEGAARDALRDQLRLMAERLWIAICVPGFLIAAAPAIYILVTNWDGYAKAGWVHIKLTLVVLLVGYHWWCGRIVGRLGGEGLSWSSKQLRLFNEIPTLLLISIVFLASMKDAVSIWWLIGSVVGLGALIGGTVALLAKRREQAPS